MNEVYPTKAQSMRTLEWLQLWTNLFKSQGIKQSASGPRLPDLEHGGTITEWPPVLVENLFCNDYSIGVKLDGNLLEIAGNVLHVTTSDRSAVAPPGMPGTFKLLTTAPSFPFTFGKVESLDVSGSSLEGLEWLPSEVQTLKIDRTHIKSLNGISRRLKKVFEISLRNLHHLGGQVRLGPLNSGLLELATLNVRDDGFNAFGVDPEDEYYTVIRLINEHVKHFGRPGANATNLLKLRKQLIEAGLERWL